MRSIIVAAFSFALLSKGVVASPFQIREQDAACPTLPIGPGALPTGLPIAPLVPVISALASVVAELEKLVGSVPLLPTSPAGGMTIAGRDEASGSTTSSDDTLANSSSKVVPRAQAPAPPANVAPTPNLPIPTDASGSPNPAAANAPTPNKSVTSKAPAAPTGDAHDKAASKAGDAHDKATNKAGDAHDKAANKAGNAHDTAANKEGAVPGAPTLPRALVRRQDGASSSSSTTDNSTATSATGSTGAPGLPTGAPTLNPPNLPI